MYWALWRKSEIYILDMYIDMVQPKYRLTQAPFWWKYKVLPDQLRINRLSDIDFEWRFFIHKKEILSKSLTQHLKCITKLFTIIYKYFAE